MVAYGSSQSVTRACTWGSNRATAAAPAEASSRPTAIQPVRPVATYSMITKMPKNSSEVPRSRSRTRTPTLSSQIIRIGPSTRPVGSWSRQILRPVQRERVAVGGEVGGEEDGEQDLGELARAGRRAAGPDPDLGAVDRREEDRHEHQGQGCGHRDVGVPLEDAVVAQDQDDERGTGRPRAWTRPAGRGRRGCRGVAQVEPVDQDQAEPVEQHRDRAAAAGRRTARGSGPRGGSGARAGRARLRSARRRAAPCGSWRARRRRSR